MKLYITWLASFLILLTFPIFPLFAESSNFPANVSECDILAEYPMLLEKATYNAKESIKKIRRALRSLEEDLSEYMLQEKQQAQYKEDRDRLWSIYWSEQRDEQWQRWLNEKRQQVQKCQAYWNANKNKLITTNYSALVIGINNYQNEHKPLEMAVNDAKEVAEVLQNDYGFEVTTLLNEKATRAGILQAYESLMEKTSEHDSVLVYFSGHGYYDKKLDKAYWLPVDATKYKYTWIMADTITLAMKSSEAKKILIVADSCYSGMLTRKVEKIELEGSKSQHADMIKRMWRNNSRILITSGGNQPVWDAGGKGHSIFTQVFLDNLRQIPEQVFTTGGLFYKIRERVAGNAEQIPQLHSLNNSGHDGGDFIFQRKLASFEPSKELKM